MSVIFLSIPFLQIVALLGVLVYKFYGEELREMFGYEEHPYGFYAMAGMLTLGCQLLSFCLSVNVYLYLLS